MLCLKTHVNSIYYWLKVVYDLSIKSFFTLPDSYPDVTFVPQRNLGKESRRVKERGKEGEK